MSCQPSRRSPHFVTLFVPLLSAKRYRLFTHSFALLFEMSTTPVRCGCPCIVPAWHPWLPQNFAPLLTVLVTTSSFRLAAIALALNNGKLCRMMLKRLMLPRHTPLGLDLPAIQSSSSCVPQ